MKNMMRVIDSVETMMNVRASMSGSVGVVTTMGALHDGHVSLIKMAQQDNQQVIVTIFVNPTQFAIGEDFDKYPRGRERDLAILRELDVDIVFTPNPEVMYPPRFQTFIDVEVVTSGLEGGSRPGHFRGVTTVVAKLFNLTLPTRAYFGQKDAQQVVVVRQMVRDLNFPLDIVVCPTAREEDGLAMSSRNVFLDLPHREAAGVIYRALRVAADAYDAGERLPNHLREKVVHVLRSEPLAKVDYVAICDPKTLFGIHERSNDPILILIAAKFGKVRLLDNALIPWSLNDRYGLSSALGNQRAR